MVGRRQEIKRYRPSKTKKSLRANPTLRSVEYAWHIELS